MNESIVRLLSGLVYVAVLWAATLYSRTSFLILFGLFLLQTVKEFASLIQLPKITSLLLAAGMYLLFGVFTSKSVVMDYGLLFASILVSVQLLIWLFSNNSNPINNSRDKWMKLIGYIILPFIFLSKMTMIENQKIKVYFPFLVLGIFVLIWTNDTFAYIVGKSIGKHKLWEKISPKKTIEGFIGGVVFTIIMAFVLSKFDSFGLVFNSFNWIVIAIIASFFGTIGDLVESKFKRIAGVKDSGTIMPGHGGIYDRLDSVIFVAPFVFLFLNIIRYVS